MVQITRRQLQTWRDDAKVATPGMRRWESGGIDGVWVLPDSEVVRDEVVMRVKGIHKSNVPSCQLILTVDGYPGHLARLCWGPTHGTDVHWHWFEDMSSAVPQERESLNPPLDPPSRAAMMEVFLERLRIEGFPIEEVMA